MSKAKYVYEDSYGGIIDHGDFIEIRWYDATAALDADGFNGWLSEFAGQVEASGRTAALVDAVQFHMPPERMSMGWRDEHIIPRYNAAGIRRFAFIMPAGMPAIGSEPSREGPASFPTGYFGARADALAWLRS